MVITEDIKEFIHNYTCYILKYKKNIQLWQFAVSSGNLENYKKEKNEIKNGKSSFWSKPDAFNKYKDKTNILLITDKTNTDVYIISEYNEKINRPWWDCSHSNNGIIKLNIIGKLNNGVSDVASFCNYKRFSIGNKFQPIKKVSFNEFINNVNKFNT